MNMEHSEYIKLQTQLQDHFDGRYVQKKDCSVTAESFTNTELHSRITGICNLSA